MTTSQDLIKQYFRSKSKQLLAAVQEAICEHPGLRGSHREEILRLYLADTLPKRFEIGKGMIYGLAHRSRECDIVILDAQNYPSLPMRGHNFFFAESVKAILEVKTEWNKRDWNDILDKCNTITNLYTLSTSNIWTDIALLQMQIEALRTDKEGQGILSSKHHIGKGAIVFLGGSSLTYDSILEDEIKKIEDEWPDILLLLDTGRVVIKHFAHVEGDIFSGQGVLEFIDAGEDALLIFTAAFLNILADRSVYIEEPLYFAQYISDILREIPREYVHFPITKPLPGSQIIW